MSETLTTGNVTIGSATWYGGSSSAIDGGKTVSGVAWQKRIKYGGASTFQSGNSFARVLAVTVPSAGTLKVYFLSGSKNKTRYVYVSSAPSSTNRDKTTAIISASDDGNDGNVASGTVSAGTYYVWCEENIGVMGVTFEASAPASAPTITTQPSSAVYAIGATPAALSVEASASSGVLSYQWYSNTTGTADPENDAAIDGAASSTLAAANISTASLGTTYYYVIVTDGQGSTTSDLASIEVVTGIAPDVSAAISASAVRAGTTVTLTATVNAGTPAPTLQWYTCDSDGSNESPIDGATNTTYQPSTASTGTYYFKVKAHNDSGDDYSDVVTLTVIAQGVSGAVGDLETISSNYTFIADNHTGNGVVGFTSGYLYDESRIFSPNGNNASTLKGSSTIDGNTYYNSLRVKSSSQDVLAFKVGGACVITFYTENPGKSRTIKVGNAVNDDSYGTISDADEEHIISIPAAGTVYLTGSGDRFIAGFKVVFNVSKTITSAGWATYCSPYALDLANAKGLTNAYIVTGATGSVLSTTSVKGGTIPANTGILIEAPVGTVTIPVVASSSTDVSKNKLVGVLENTEKAAESIYVLMDETAGVGFYKNNNAFTVGANTAYLNANFAEVSGSARAAYFFRGDITGVNQVEAASEAEVKEGKFIENGKLVIVKNGVKYNAAGAKLY